MLMVVGMVEWLVLCGSLEVACKQPTKVFVVGKLCTRVGVFVCLWEEVNLRVAEAKAFECKDEEGARAFVQAGATQELT